MPYFITSSNVLSESVNFIKRNITLFGEVQLMQATKLPVTKAAVTATVVTKTVVQLPTLSASFVVIISLIFVTHIHSFRFLFTLK